MKTTLLVIAAFGLATLSLGAQVTFTVGSSAVSGAQETGFDSKLVSAGRIDSAFTGGKSLPFTWSGLPAGTKSIAIVFDDPDARLVMYAYGVAGDFWVHWLVADLDPTLGGLAADASASGNLVLGKNTGGQAAYMGPQPPADVPANAKRPIIHTYRLKLYALSAPTGLKTGFSYADLMKAIADKTLGTAQMNMSYSK